MVHFSFFIVHRPLSIFCFVTIFDCFASKIPPKHLIAPSHRMLTHPAIICHPYGVHLFPINLIHRSIYPDAYASGYNMSPLRGSLLLGTLRCTPLPLDTLRYSGHRSKRRFRLLDTLALLEATLFTSRYASATRSGALAFIPTVY